MTCDLHTHTFHSDGTDSPRTLAKLARERGLSAIALTDHNTVAGLDDFLVATADEGIIGISGIEISTDYKNIELHIIGLFIEPKYYDEVTAFVTPMMERKAKANDELVQRLIADGYKIDYERAKREAGGQVNRAHIATELVRGGYISTPEEAFSGLLKKNGKYYTLVKRIDVFETIRFIKSIGGVAIFAHPFLELNESELREFLPLAREAGLDAMEVYYTKFDENTTALAKSLADEFGLLPSGGSDYHGWRKPGTELGTGKGNLRVDFSIYEDILKRKG